MNADLNRGYASEEHGAYASCIHKIFRYLISPELISDLNNIIRQPRFAQIYIFDLVNELQNRMNAAFNPNVLPETMRMLQDIMHRINPFVGLFKMIDDH